jgi:hypothetical protein
VFYSPKCSVSLASRNERTKKNIHNLTWKSAVLKTSEERGIESIQTGSRGVNWFKIEPIGEILYFIGVESSNC